VRRSCACHHVASDLPSVDLNFFDEDDPRTDLSFPPTERILVVVIAKVAVSMQWDEIPTRVCSDVLAVLGSAAVHKKGSLGTFCRESGHKICQNIADVTVDGSVRRRMESRGSSIELI
jgi:hypothetical protein